MYYQRKLEVPITSGIQTMLHWLTVISLAFKIVEEFNRQIRLNMKAEELCVLHSTLTEQNHKLLEWLSCCRLSLVWCLEFWDNLLNDALKMRFYFCIPNLLFFKTNEGMASVFSSRSITGMSYLKNLTPSLFTALLCCYGLLNVLNSVCWSSNKNVQNKKKKNGWE